MRRAAAASAALAASVAGAPLLADPGDGPHTIQTRTIETMVELADGERADIAWELTNTSGHALTVHGLASDRAETLTLQRRRRLFGFDLYQDVPFLRLEAGEVMRLQSPDYALQVEGLVPSGATIFVITLDLGPDGESSFALIEPFPPG